MAAEKEKKHRAHEKTERHTKNEPKKPKKRLKIAHEKVQKEKTRQRNVNILNGVYCMRASKAPIQHTRIEICDAVTHRNR